MNVDDVENAGLADIIADLDTVYTENGYDSVLSRADFWALAGMYSVDKAVINANDECDEEDCEVPDSGLVFQWGRADCDTAPYTDSDDGLPSATMGHDDVGAYRIHIGIYYFNLRLWAFLLLSLGSMPMKLWHSWELIPWAKLLQAILGFLEFGSMERVTCSTMNITRLSDLNNLSLILEQFQRLVDSDLDWKHRDATRNTDTTHWQWNVPGSTFMLDVDVCLYKVGLVGAIQ